MGRFTIFSLGVDALQIGIISVIVRGSLFLWSPGPALVHLNFKSLLGQGVMLQYVLPVEENVQKLVHMFYTSRTWIPPYAKVSLHFCQAQGHGSSWVGWAVKFINRRVSPGIGSVFGLNMFFRF